MSTPPESNRFDESVKFDDPKPFTNWVPSPRQIQAWAAVIREERLESMSSEPWEGDQ